MSIADFVVMGVRPRYSHVESECPRVEGDGEYTEMIRSLCFLIDCFDREGTAQQPDLETVDKYVCVNKSWSPAFVEVEALERLFAFVARLILGWLRFVSRMRWIFMDFLSSGFYIIAVLTRHE
eukprot:scaffold92751_cov45-Attheya_sp.AAC.1